MNVFCTYIKNEIQIKFNIEVDIFISKKKKKKLVHLAFDEPSVS